MPCGPKPTYTHHTSEELPATISQVTRPPRGKRGLGWWRSGVTCPRPYPPSVDWLAVHFFLLPWTPLLGELSWILLDFPGENCQEASYGRSLLGPVQVTDQILSHALFCTFVGDWLHTQRTKVNARDIPCVHCNQGHVVSSLDSTPNT